ncbi:MAG TPA: TonB family protein [Opitutaceae bacterium]|nr:TonB family protein [Opitutaceae bacterium]
MTDDSSLLQRFAESGSQDAFAEVVRRHLDLVYSAALRRVGGDAHLARDVSQQVFIALARRAAALARHPVLTGWLYTTTHYLASKAVRAERRRRIREQTAQAMNDLLSSPGPETDWTRLRPALDDAMLELGTRDREAVLLRFFRGRPFGEIGVRFGLSENAARMRVDRALEKLRARLARQGVASTAAALALLLGENAVGAAPAGLAASVSGAAVAGAAAGGGSLAFWSFMSASKLVTGVTAAAVIAAGVVMVQQQRAIGRLQSEAADLETQNQALSALRAGNRRLQQQQQGAADELAQLQADRAEVARLRTAAAALQAQVRDAEAAFRAHLVPVAKPSGLKPADGASVYNLNQLDVIPQVQHQVPPKYPLAMRFDGVPGEVNVGFIVGSDGQVVDATVIGTTDPAFSDVAVTAVRQWQFTPGRKAGQPVNTRLSVPVVFSVNPSPAPIR